MLTSYSRVTVLSDARRVDLALPSALPLAEVLPQVLRFCAPAESPHAPAEMSLAKVGGQPLSLSQTLAESGVHDGDVIELRALTAPSRAAFVEDVRDSLEDAVDDAGGAWTSRSTATFAIVAVSVILGLVFLDRVRGTFSNVVTGLARSGELAHPNLSPVDGRIVANAAVAAAVLAAATWVGSRRAARWSAYVSSTVAALWATLAGAEIAQGQTTSGFAQLSVGMVGGVVVAGGCRVMTRRAIPLFVATVCWLVASLILLVLDASTVPVGVVVRLLALLAVLAIGIMPRLSIAVGGISSADYRVRKAGHLSEGALNTRLQESSGLLLGALYGVSAIAAVIGAGLAFSDSWWDRLMSLSVAVALILRSRVFSRTQHMLPLRAGAVVVLTAQTAAATERSAGFADWFPAAVSATGAALIAVSIIGLSDITRARIKRLLNAVEFIVIVDLIVVTMAAIGLYDRYSPR